jgi:hypothetical protein
VETVDGSICPSFAVVQAIRQGSREASSCAPLYWTSAWKPFPKPDTCLCIFDMQGAGLQPRQNDLGGDGKPDHLGGLLIRWRMALDRGPATPHLRGPGISATASCHAPGQGAGRAAEGHAWPAQERQDKEADRSLPGLCRAAGALVRSYAFHLAASQGCFAIEGGGLQGSDPSRVLHSGVSRLDTQEVIKSLTMVEGRKTASKPSGP